jgi:type I restriction-modification system DNA methylase subunit
MSSAENIEYALDLTPTELIDAFISTRHAYLETNLYNDFYILNNIIQNSQYSDFFSLGQSSFYKGYGEFREKLIEYAEDDSGFKKSESATIRTRIEKVLDMLGWYEKCKGRGEHPFSEGTTYSVDNVSYELDLGLCDGPHEASTINRISGAKKGSDKELKNMIKKNVITILEAKAYSKLKKGKVKKKKSSMVRDTASSLGPEGQMLEYLQSSKVTQGILTDGSKWKLFHKDLSDSEIIRSLNFDFDSLLKDARRISSGEMSIFPYHFETAARLFYFFFSKESHDPKRSDMGNSTIELISNKCVGYANDLEEVLKGRFMEAMNVVCNSLYLNSSQKDKLNTDSGRRLIRNCSESFLFNLIFVKSCEMNSILPVEQHRYREVMVEGIVERISGLDPSYFKANANRNLESMCKNFFGEGYCKSGNDLFNRIIKVFSEIYNGNTSLQIDDGFKESVFTKEEWKFLKTTHITNNDLVKILYKLSYLYIEGESQKIPYNYLRPRQFGEVYESFLEFQLEFADQNYYYNKKKSQLIPLKSWEASQLKDEEFRVKKGKLFFTPDNKDRKLSGSYYTPHYVVKQIVKNTLCSLVDKKENYEEILNITVCDPAMGSGHFLNYTLRYLTKQYRLKYQNEYGVSIGEGFNASARKVLDRCIFGVDLNDSAVKLTKLTLWLASAHRGKKLERLDDQLMQGNSLLSFDWKKSFPRIFKESKGFDSVIGNPPYIRVHNLSSAYKEELWNNFLTFKAKGDIYSCFIEKGISLLSPEGKLSFITPKTWASSESFTELRKFVYENTSIVNYFQLPTKVFKDASVNTFFFLLENKKEDENEVEIYDLNESGKTEIIGTFPQSRIKDAHLYNLLLESDSDVTALVDNMNRSFGKLDDYVDFSYGFKTGDDKKYLSEAKDGETYKPYLKSRNIKAFEFPKHVGYIDYRPEDMKKNKKTARPGDKKRFERPKIIVARMGKDLVCTVDFSKKYVKDAMILHSKKDDKSELYYYTALLNSECINNIYKNSFVTIDVLKNAILNLPLPEYNEKDHKKIVELCELIYSSKDESEKLKLVALLNKEVDNIVLGHFVEFKEVA